MTAEAKADLGGHPMQNMLKMIVFALLLTAIIGGGAYLVAKEFAGIVMLIAFFLWGLAAFRFPGALIAGLINSRNYNAAKKLVAEGKLNVSYVGRNLTCLGLAVVDEQNKRLYVNGRLYDFADVKAINARSALEGSTTEHFVEVVVNHGEVPVHKVCFDDSHKATAFYHRLANSLGLS